MVNPPPHLRIARPTDHLSEVIHFYRDGLGFELLSSFEDHDGFDGAMLGRKDWQVFLQTLLRHRD
jgi:catechol 2,3-dioxygenase-like lactoylglutathione lyase family enzyme